MSIINKKRMSGIDVLYSDHVIPRSPSPDPNTCDVTQCVLLDWDDTLFPTTVWNDKVKMMVYRDNKTGKIVKITSTQKPRRGQYQNHWETFDVFCRELNRVGVAAFNLLSMLCSNDPSLKIKIVTNSEDGWVHSSLDAASKYCPIFKNIQLLLIENNIPIICGQSKKIHRSLWKVTKYHDLLCSHFAHAQISSMSVPINVITIGDQWWDHESLCQSGAFRAYHHLISRHAIKMFERANCEYMAKELEFIRSLFKTNSPLYNFCPSTETELLEFDGQ